MARKIEQFIPPILEDGYNSNKNVTLGGSANFDASGSTGTFKTPTGAATLGGSLTVATGKTLTITDTTGLLLGSIIAPAYLLSTDNQNQVSAANYAVSHTIFVNDSVSGTYKLVAVAAVFGTTSTSGTLQVEVATGTQAIASGTNNLTGTMSLSGTANTVVNGTIIATPTTIAAGARINLIFAGTVTGLANASITVTLQRLS